MKIHLKNLAQWIMINSLKQKQDYLIKLLNIIVKNGVYVNSVLVVDIYVIFIN